MIRHLASLAALTVAATASPAQSASPLQVVDSQGKVLGRYFTSGLGGLDMAAITVPTGLASLSLTPDATDSTVWGWSATGTGSVYFHSADCTGIAYLSIGNAPRGLLPGIVTSGTLHHYLWVADPGPPIALADNLARSTYANDACVPFFQNAHAYTVYRSVTPPVDLAVSFTPPFTLR